MTFYGLIKTVPTQQLSASSSEIGFRSLLSDWVTRFCEISGDLSFAQKYGFNLLNTSQNLDFENIQVFWKSGFWEKHTVL